MPLSKFAENRCSVAAEILDIVETSLVATFTTSGTLNRWSGPAIRGLVLRPLRDRLCLLARPERSAMAPVAGGDHERYCRGCYRMNDCLYGRVFEPDLVQLARPIKRGAQEGLRGLSLATNLTRHWRLPPDATERDSLPQPSADCEAVVRVQPGSLLPIRLLQIGSDAQQLRESVIKMLQECGQSQGLGPDSAKFQIDRANAADRRQRLELASLPLRPVEGVLPRVRIHLVSPLFLKARKQPPRDRQQGRRRLASDCLGRLSFLTLFREALRTVRRAVNEYAASDWSDDADMRFLIESAERVKVIDSNMHPYRQSRTSARQVSRWMLSGWSGSITVVDVPLHLMPYLYWAGQIGVGDGRNCGAGLWEIELW